MLEQLFRGRRRARLELHVRDRQLARVGIGTADRGGERHRRMAPQRILDQRGIDAVPAALDQILHPAGDPDVAVGVHAAEIADIELPAGVAAGRRSDPWWGGAAKTALGGTR